MKNLYLYVKLHQSKKTHIFSSLARNHKFFRAGEISWDQGTFIDILLKTPEKKTLLGKIWVFFLLDTLRTTLLMENLTQRWT